MLLTAEVDHCSDEIHPELLCEESHVVNVWSIGEDLLVGGGTINMLIARFEQRKKKGSLRPTPKKETDT